MYEVLSSELVFILWEYIERMKQDICAYVYIKEYACTHIFSSSNKVLRIFDSIPQ